MNAELYVVNGANKRRAGVRMYILIEVSASH
jgi:hypothetical protein